MMLLMAHNIFIGVSLMSCVWSFITQSFMQPFGEHYKVPGEEKKSAGYPFTTLDSRLLWTKCFVHVLNHHRSDYDVIIITK